ncbi:MAG: hypothetical protein AB8H80_23775 [Planctomycetota bacterium]
MSIAEYPHGWDVEWVAVDQLLRVAIFTTAGDGPIPSGQLRRWKSFGTLSQALLAGPETCGHELFAKVPRPDDFVRFARHGFFAFDWHSDGRGLPHYRLQARPLQPRLVSDLQVAPDVSVLLAACVGARLDFGNRELDVGAAFDCLRG